MLKKWMLVVLFLSFSCNDDMGKLENVMPTEPTTTTTLSGMIQFIDTYFGSTQDTIEAGRYGNARYIRFINNGEVVGWLLADDGLRMRFKKGLTDYLNISNVGITCFQDGKYRVSLIGGEFPRLEFNEKQVLGPQQPAIANSNGSAADNARAINEILEAMRTHGQIARGAADQIALTN